MHHIISNKWTNGYIYLHISNAYFEYLWYHILVSSCIDFMIQENMYTARLCCFVKTQIMKIPLMYWFSGNPDNVGFFLYQNHILSCTDQSEAGLGRCVN